MGEEVFREVFDVQVGLYISTWCWMRIKAWCERVLHQDTSHRHQQNKLKEVQDGGVS